MFAYLQHKYKLCIKTLKDMKIKAFVEKVNDKSFACCADQKVNGCLLVGYGTSADSAVADFYKSYDELKEMDGEENTPAIDVEFSYDIGSFFNKYRFLTIGGVADIAGIQPSILRQYVAGMRRPKPDKIKKVKDACITISNILRGVSLGNVNTSH